jgi:transposase
MGGSTNSVYTWQKQYSQPVKVIQDVDTQADEIGRLMRDLARVTDVRDIIRKATA